MQVQNTKPAAEDPLVNHDCTLGILSSELSPSPLPLHINVFYRVRENINGAGGSRKKLCMSNCRGIEVAVLWPLNSSPPSSDSSNSGIDVEVEEINLKEGMDADQEHDNSCSSGDPSPISPDTTTQQSPFRFLDLPLELRLKIYGYLLPPREHKIVTQIPHNGFYYNTSTIPLHSAQSFYPFGTAPPPQPASFFPFTNNGITNNGTSQKEKLTTYKVLTANFRSDFPSLSIHPEILRVSKQVLREAEPVLYGNKDTVFDFGTHLDAALAFFGDRSENARRSVKRIKIAREVPSWLGKDVYGKNREDELWVRFCGFVGREMRGLRELDFCVWCADGSTQKFPIAADEDGEGGEEESKKKWAEWEYIASLVRAEGLREARVTWWGFGGQTMDVFDESGNVVVAGSSTGRFDSWIAKRMVGDVILREEMVRDGVVREGVVVLRGSGA